MMPRLLAPLAVSFLWLAACGRPAVPTASPKAEKPAEIARPADPAGAGIVGVWKMRVTPDMRTFDRDAPELIFVFSPGGDFTMIRRQAQAPLDVQRGRYQVGPGGQLTITPNADEKGSAFPVSVGEADRAIVTKDAIVLGPDGKDGAFDRYRPPSVAEMARGSLALSRSLGTTIKNELRLIDAAKDQYAIEQKKSNMTPRWSDLTPYFKPGSKLALQPAPADPLGNPYLLGDLATTPKVSRPTRQALANACDEAFWSPY